MVVVVVCLFNWNNSKWDREDFYGGEGVYKHIKRIKQ